MVPPIKSRLNEGWLEGPTAVRMGDLCPYCQRPASGNLNGEMSPSKTRVALIAINLFVSATTAAGAIVVVPALPKSYLTIFPDYTIPALGLGAVSLASFGAAAAVAWRPKVGAELSVVAGAMMACFEVVEALTTGNLLAPPPGTSGGGALWLQPFYFVVGLAMIILGLRLWGKTEPGQTWSARLLHPLTA